MQSASINDYESSLTDKVTNSPLELLENHKLCKLEPPNDNKEWNVHSTFPTIYFQLQLGSN